MFSFKISGQDKLRDYFLNAPKRLQTALKDRLSKIGIQLAAQMKQNLSDNVLHVRSGRLRRSINSTLIRNADGSYKVSVGTNVVYAAAHEYGIRKAVQVKPHQRRQTKAFGRSITPRAVSVRGHIMRMNLPERSFARLALRQKGPEIQADLANFIAQEMKKIRTGN